MCYTITAESNGERIVKIGQHLLKLCVRIKCPVFLTHGVVVTLVKDGWFAMGWKGIGVISCSCRAGSG